MTKKITELTALTTSAGADLIPIVDDVVGTPITKKITVTNLIDNNAAVALNTAKATYPGSADATELNILEGATLSTAELNYVDGVTSAIQTQMDTKPDSITSGVDGADVISNMMSLTAAEYAAIASPNSSTLYIITDA